eukprot:3455087-Pyramimonas_sp.AAC.1
MNAAVTVHCSPAYWLKCFGPVAKMCNNLYSNPLDNPLVEPRKIALFAGPAASSVVQRQPLSKTLFAHAHGRPGPHAPGSDEHFHGAATASARLCASERATVRRVYPATRGPRGGDGRQRTYPFDNTFGNKQQGF